MTGHQQPDSDVGVSQELEHETKEPSMYRVILINDDYTTMEFVVEILVTVFNKRYDDATSIMLKVHQEGSGVCGVYTFEVAETKVETVHRLAREKGFPLKCTMERE